MKFKLEALDSATNARAAVLETAHGDIPTPIFMPVGTAGTVKGIYQHELKNNIDAKIILGNTYHLYLRPGTATLEAAGGLHKFIGWDRPILTDSGGYQVFSLSQMRKIKEQGATFSSHIDGSKHLFSPESVMDTQRSIGADIVMAFDECTPYPCDFKDALTSMELTHRWLDRCVTHFENTEPKYGYAQSLFPIVQGSTYPELRKISAEYIASKGLDGNAIGGLSVGEPAEMMYEMTEQVTAILPKDKPRYLMGVGTPINILECIALGIDMFDCVMPTRNGRNGMIFTRRGILNMRNEKWRNDFSPLDPDSDLEVDQVYTRAYVAHLLRNKEMLGAQIASQHNLHFYLWLVKTAREHIIAGTFLSWKKDMVAQLGVRL